MEYFRHKNGILNKKINASPSLNINLIQAIFKAGLFYVYSKANVFSLNFDRTDFLIIITGPFSGKYAWQVLCSFLLFFLLFVHSSLCGMRLARYWLTNVK